MNKIVNLNGQEISYCKAHKEKYGEEFRVD